MNILRLMACVSIALAVSASATFAGSLSASQQSALDQMALQVLGPVPTDGNYGGASITGNTEQKPAGRTDCAKVKVVDSKGTWQRWKCGPGLGSASGSNAAASGDWSAWGVQPNGRTDCVPSSMNNKLYPVGTPPKRPGQFRWACPN